MVPLPCRLVGNPLYCYDYCWPAKHNVENNVIISIELYYQQSNLLIDSKKWKLRGMCVQNNHHKGWHNHHICRSICGSRHPHEDSSQSRCFESYCYDHVQLQRLVLGPPLTT